MMSLIFSTGWKQSDAERLWSAGKCRVVRNTNVFICEEQEKREMVSIAAPNHCLPALSRGWRGSEPRDWQVDSTLMDTLATIALTDPQSGPSPEWTRAGDAGRKINKEWGESHNMLVHCERHWGVSFQIRHLMFRRINDSNFHRMIYGAKGKQIIGFWWRVADKQKCNGNTWAEQCMISDRVMIMQMLLTSN